MNGMKLLVIYLRQIYISYRWSSYLDVVQAVYTIRTHITLKEKFDLICIDIFVDDKIPAEALSMEFLQGQQIVLMKMES